MSEAEYGEVSKHRFWMINGVVVLGLLVIIYAMSLLPGGLETMAAIEALQIVAGTLGAVSLVFYLRQSMAVFEVWLVLGIPVGLLGGNIGLHGMASSMQADPNMVGPAGSVMLLCGMYGAIFSAIGYFASRNNEHPLPKRINGFQLAFMWVVLGALWVLPMATGAGLATFISLPSFVLYLGFIFMAILMNTDNKKSLVHCVADAALAGIMVSLVAALAIWFKSSPQVDLSAVGFGSIGILYGTMIYIGCYMVSLKTGETDQINFRVKNWHLVEANTFYIFLVFAPVNLGESLFNELDEIERVKMVQQQDSMRSEISMLTERLAKLEGS